MERQTFLGLNIWYIFYVKLWLKYVFMSFVIHCILFFFTFYSDPVHSDPVHSDPVLRLCLDLCVTFSIPEGWLHDECINS